MRHYVWWVTSATLAALTLLPGCPPDSGAPPAASGTAATGPAVSYGAVRADVARRFELVGRAGVARRFELVPDLRQGIASHDPQVFATAFAALIRASDRQAVAHALHLGASRQLMPRIRWR